MKHRTPALAAPALAALAVSGLLFGPTLLTGRALWWGTLALQFVPWWDWAARTLAAGQLPLWNPALGLGAPLFANYQSALLYPPTWGYLLLGWLGGAPWIGWGLALGAAAHLTWVALGMSALGRRLGFSPLGATAAGLAYAFSGGLIGRVMFVSQVSALAWVPWLLWAVEGVLQADAAARPARLRRLALVTGLLLLAGHAQTAWYALVLAGVWALARAPRPERRAPRSLAAGPRSLVAAALPLAGALLWGAALAAAQLLPTAEYLAQTPRAAAVPYVEALTYSFWPWRALGLIAPGWFGSPASGDYWGYAAYWEDALYLGLLPLILAAAALIGGLRRRDPLVRLLALIGALSLLLALGWNTPVFPWLYRHVPTFSLFQAPARWLVGLSVALALLAGRGLSDLRRPTGRGQYWARLATAGSLALTLGAGAAALLLADVAPTTVRAVAWAGLWACGAGVWVLTAPPAADPAAPRRWTLGVTMWLVLELAWAGWGQNPSAPRAFYAAAPAAPPAAGRLYLPPELERVQKFERFFHFDDFTPSASLAELRAARLPNLPLLQAAWSVNNFDPFTPRRSAELLTALAQAPAAARAGLLDRLAVGAVAVPAGAGVRYLPRPLPGWARFSPCAEYAAPADLSARLLELAAQGSFAPLLTAERAAAACPLIPFQPVSVQWRAPGRVRLTRPAGQPAGWVTLSQEVYPGWRAAVDGVPTDLLLADGAFAAVAVPAGARQIDLTYRPESVGLGALISLIAWAGLLWRAWVGRLPRRPA